MGSRIPTRAGGSARNRFRLLSSLKDPVIVELDRAAGLHLTETNKLQPLPCGAQPAGRVYRSRVRLADPSENDSGGYLLSRGG